MTQLDVSNRKHFYVYITLASLFLASAITAEVVGAKIFSLEKLFGMTPISFKPIFPEGINLSAGVIIWPVVFVISDIINEYFGKAGVKRISYLGAGMIGFAFIIIYMATVLPPSDFWLRINSADDAGNHFNINFAFNSIFRQGLGIIVGSITAFLASQLVDAYIFFWVRRITHHKLLWLRATGSTVVSQIIDSFIVLFIAFYLLGNWTLSQVLSVGFGQYIYKIGLAILLTPLIYVAHNVIDKYLGKQESIKIIDKAEHED